MWKNILSLAALVLSVGISARLIPGANAEPQTSLGSHPAASYGGHITGNAFTVFTNPSDQAFVVKTLFVESNCDIYVGSAAMLLQGSYFAPARIWFNAGSHDHANSGSAFTTGNANLKVPAGESLSIHGCDNLRYYVDGYSVQP